MLAVWVLCDSWHELTCMLAVWVLCDSWHEPTYRCYRERIYLLCKCAREAVVSGTPFRGTLVELVWSSQLLGFIKDEKRSCAILVHVRGGKKTTWTAHAWRHWFCRGVCNVNTLQKIYKKKKFQRRTKKFRRHGKPKMWMEQELLLAVHIFF